MSTTRRILRALRDADISARSGCHPINTPQHAHNKVEVLDAAVINLCPYDELGYGCWNHPRYNEVHEALAARVSAVLTKLGVEHRRASGSDVRVSSQFYINGYKA